MDLQALSMQSDGSAQHYATGKISARYNKPTNLDDDIESIRDGKRAWQKNTYTQYRLRISGAYLKSNTWVRFNP
jgi:hypothetical protein